MLTITQILELVEFLAGGAEELPEKQTNADRRLTAIYKVVHSHGNSTCASTHQDWKEESLKLYKDNQEHF